MGSANDGLRAKSSQSLFFVNSFLLNHSHAYSFPSVYGCTKATASEMGRCNGNWPTELNGFLWSFTERRKKNVKNASGCPKVERFELCKTRSEFSSVSGF